MRSDTSPSHHTGLWRVVVLLGLAAASLVSCGGTSQVAASDAGTSANDGSADDGSSVADDAAGGADASTDASTGSDPLDGQITRQQCTDALGSALTTTFGRMDGYLVSIVPVGQHSCNGDSTHVHLQVLIKNAVYDVAVNTDGLEAQLDHALVGAPWTEGWNPAATLDYPTNLGIHSAAFATTNAESLVSSLSAVNHISVFATGYGPTGAHLVHRDLNNHDGAVVMDPVGTAPHYLVFRFSTDSF
jgi:hypothetical protein